MKTTFEKLEARVNRLKPKPLYVRCRRADGTVATLAATEAMREGAEILLSERGAIVGNNAAAAAQVIDYELKREGISWT